MKPRSHWPEGERSARSKLTQLLHNEPFVKASMVKMTRTCGKETCVCVRKGKKHVSWYVALQYQGKRRMICVPTDKVEAVRRAVGNYKTIVNLCGVISTYCFERIWNIGKTDSR